MKGLERAFEFLRPFVDSQIWDYCVVWKLGDDPSRFIEWMGCCCGGGRKESDTEEMKQSVPLCRDLYFVHKINSKTCEALASFPSSLPLYSGIYGDVVTSTQSKWINHSPPPDSSHNEAFGTRVLIPVLGGLIELFAAKYIVKDQKIIDFITSHCSVLKQESMVVPCYPSLDEFGLDPFLEQNLHNLAARSHLLSLLPRKGNPHQLNQCNTRSSLERSSGCSDLSNDHGSLDLRSGYLSQNGVLKLSVENPPDLRKCKNDKINLKHQGNRFPDCNNRVSKGPNKPEFRSKNLVTERNRRNRINDGIFTLRSLVPKITKMNKVATLGDAIAFIHELQEEVKNLESELREMEEEEGESKKSNTDLMSSRLETSIEGKKNLAPNVIELDSTSVCQKRKIEAKTEVNQIGKREFLIKILSEKKKGGFVRLVDLICSLGLQVVHVNMTTCNGQAVTVLTVEDVQLKRLKESLMKLGG